MGFGDNRVSITVDEQGFRRQVNDLARQVGLTGRTVMLDQMRLWVSDLIRKTPPKTLAQGRKRVAKDINKVFVAVDPHDMHELRRGDILFMVHRYKNGGYAVEKDQYRPSASKGTLRRHHSNLRRKDGRVTEARGGSEAGRNTLDIGRWKFIDKMHIPKRLLKSYIRDTQKHVGTLKAGWMPAALAFNAKVPNFVKKNARRAGRFTDAMGKDGEGFLLAVNSVPYAPAKIGKLPAVTAQTRNRDLDRQLKKEFARVIKTENAKKAR